MTKYSISPLMLIFTAAFVLIDGTVYALFAVFFSFLHELAHIVTLRFVGGKVRSLKGSGFGIGLEAADIGYRQELTVCLSGPLLSLLLFVLLLPFYKLSPLSLFCCFSNLAIFCVNILPVFPLDGGRAIFCALCMKKDLQTAQRITRIISCIFLLPLCFVSVIILIRTGYNLSLLIISIYLCMLLIGVKNI